MRLTDLLDMLPGRSTDTVVLELDLARGLIDVRPTNPLQALQTINAPHIQAIRDHLHAAAADDRVVGLIVHAVHPGHPIAMVDEVGLLIEEFGQSKPTVAWAETFGEASNELTAYKLATACHAVWLQPTGRLGIGGAELQIVLARGLFEKVGITPQFGQRKEYKSAADQYAADHVTDANREMTQRLGQSIVDDAVFVIARRRGLSPEAVWEAVNRAPLTADDAREAGLIDEVGYRDEVYADALKQWRATAEDLRFVHRHQPKPSLAKLVRRGPKVAVVSLRGAIVLGRGAPAGPMGESVGSDVVGEQLRAATRDDDVKAVLFEIDSPGGSAVASDTIHRAVQQVRASGRPVVARMGNVAASGGYYAAMGCDEIVAMPTTITGSIGVLAGKLVTQGMFAKLGLVREPVHIGARAGMMSSATEFTEEDWRILDEELDRIYDDFTTLAARDRGMSLEDLEAVARGRVWTGTDAHERGLVDHLGGWRLAWRRTCSLAGIDPEEARVEHVGGGSLVERLRPAASSESRTGTVIVPTAEALFMQAAAWVGLPVHGPLSLPFRLDVR